MTFKKSFLSVFTLIAICFLSCERDDICPQSTQTTPRLVITFKDINNPEIVKPVRRLSVFGVGNETSLIVNNTDTQILNLPLKFDSENQTITRFSLKKDSDFDIDGNELTISNIDIIEIIYTPQFIYVSRACGYKSIFNEAQINYETDSENWILNTEIINSTIDNENDPHIIIYH